MAWKRRTGRLHRRQAAGCGLCGGRRRILCPVLPLLRPRTARRAKLSGSPVGDRSQVVKADYSIYLDDTLFTEAAFDELKENGKIILNTRRTIEDERVITLDGTAIAQEILRMPITNTIMLGAFAAVSGIVSAGAVEQAIRENMPEKLQVRNIAAVSAAIREVAG